MAAIASLYERNQEATVYAGSLDQKVNENLLWELFTQCGPVVNVHVPRDKITNEHQGYGFIEFKSEEDADYAIKIMNMIKLFGKPLKVNKASQDKRTQDVGANLFVGNLDPEVDEKLLYETFSNFGSVISTKITRDPEDGTSKGHGFVSYDNFDSSDHAISQMQGQFFSGRQIKVEYAIKSDTKGRDKHGTYAERLLAENRPTTAPTLIKPPIQMNATLIAEKNFRDSSGGPAIPLAKGGINPTTLPAKPSVVKMPEIKLPTVPLPPTPK